MAIKFYPNADEVIEIVLACDPSLQEANTEEVLAKYLATGDDSDLEKPEDVSVFKIKPLTVAQLSIARRKAGRASVLGDEIKKKLDSANLKAMENIQKALGLAIGEERELTEDELDSDEFKPSFTLDDLSDKEYKAYNVTLAYDEAFNDALVKLGMKADTGGDLANIRPLNFQMKVRNELFVHILRATNMSAEGKD